MFKFLKEKLSSWIKGTKNKVKTAEPEIREEKLKKQKTEEEKTKVKTEDLLTERTAPTITEIKQEKEQKKSIFAKIKEKISYKLTQEDFEEIFSELETLLLESNVALEVVDKIKEKLSKELLNQTIKKQEIEEKIKQSLKSILNEILIEPDDILEIIKSNSGEEPFKILFFGINGTGKTTSIAKIAYLLKKNNISCVLAAADTFRAASIEQIQQHADTLGIKLIKHDYNADPSAVAFDAIKHAKAHKIKVVLIDTAGRIHTKENLIKEMEKISRVTNPDLKIFVAESIAGNDAVEQARVFNEAIEIDGSILSKTDVDEKGGTILSISYITKKPIFYLGTGQNYEDLELFNKEKFIKQLGLE